MASAPIFIEKIIQEKKIVFFSKTYSPECLRIKELFEKYQNVLVDGSVTTVELDKRSDSSEFEDYLQKLSDNSRRQVPLLFIGGRYLGCYEDILRLHADRRLAQIFIDALEDKDPMGDRDKMAEVVVTFAKVDRTEVVVRYCKDFSMLPMLDNEDDERKCYHGDEEGRLYDPWITSGQTQTDLPGEPTGSFLVEASSSLQLMRRDMGISAKTTSSRT